MSSRLERARQADAPLSGTGQTDAPLSVRRKSLAHARDIESRSLSDDGDGDGDGDDDDDTDTAAPPPPIGRASSAQNPPTRAISLIRRASMPALRRYSSEPGAARPGSTVAGGGRGAAPAPLKDRTKWRSLLSSGGGTSAAPPGVSTATILPRLSERGSSSSVSDPKVCTPST